MKLFVFAISVVPSYADENRKDEICILLDSLKLLVDNFIDKQKGNLTVAFQTVEKGADRKKSKTKTAKI